MLRIGICGAHGTGKTTLLNEISKTHNIPPLQRLIRSFYENIGINNFELLPKDVRNPIQNYLLINQIENENKTEGDFVSDRTAVDYISHTVLDTNKSLSELDIYKNLIKERLARYTHIIYCPVEFEVEEEFLRAALDKRAEIDKIIKQHLDLWIAGKYLTVTGSVENRMKQINFFLYSK
jgi:deoxyadenosine/deoxycytidine kinase